MKKINIKLLILTSIITLLPIITGILLMSKLPEQLPIHFDASGVANSFASKNFVVYGMPFMFVGLNIITIVLTTLDPKRANNKDKIVNIFYWIVPILSNFVINVTYYIGLGHNLNITIGILVFVGLTFVIIGNYMPKIKQNTTIGIKTSWTLNNEEVWFKTHRVAGKIWFFGGILMMFIGFIPAKYIFVPMIVLITIITGIPIVYSYVIYSKIEKEKTEKGE